MLRVQEDAGGLQGMLGAQKDAGGMQGMLRGYRGCSGMQEDAEGDAGDALHPQLRAFPWPQELTSSSASSADCLE